MAELIAVGFKNDVHRASDVLNNVLRLGDDWVVELQDAVAVYRDDSGKLLVDHSYRISKGEGAGWGALWGLIIGSLLAVPFTAGASVAAAGAAVAVGAVGGTALGAEIGAIEASSWNNDFGIPDDFVQQVGALVQPGDSAIFAILRAGDPEVVADQFRSYGGTMLRTTLSPEQRTKVEKALSASAG